MLTASLGLLQGVCHRDLKLENTLLDGSPAPRVKICDFGYSKSVLDSQPKSTVGTPAYIAPEVGRCWEERPWPQRLAQPAGLHANDRQATARVAAVLQMLRTLLLNRPRVRPAVALRPPVLQVLQRTAYNGHGADVWSCGVTLYVMLVGAYPFEDHTDPRNFSKTIKARPHCSL